MEVGSKDGEGSQWTEVAEGFASGLINDYALCYSKCQKNRRVLRADGKSQSATSVFECET